MGSLGCITWREVEPRVVRFRDPMGFQCHLVLGDEVALLVDTMGGHGNLREAVAQVTDLPVTVAATHSHFDHVAGAWFFGAIWMSPREVGLALAESHAAIVHEHVLASGMVGEGEPWCLRDGSRPVVKDLSEGHVFDLGGITVETVALPGHTAGSLGFLVRELGVLFTGDAVSPTMCLFFEDSLDVAGYRLTIARMTTLPFERFYTSHHDRTFLRSDLTDFDACAAYCATDPGSEWVHALFSELRGRIHIYRGTSPDDDDFLALIERDTPEAKEHAQRMRAERRAARRAAQANRQS